MTRLTEEMVIARTRANDIGSIRKLNVWGSGLSDVSLIRKMQSVEVVSLSVNKIASLADFQWCRNLQELYVRRNEIRDLNQVCYLRDLPRLRSLWLDENPCASAELYRVTVLRALPHLQKLDNVAVAPEEVAEALVRGRELNHPDDVSAAPRAPSPISRREDYELAPYYDDYEEPVTARRPSSHFQTQSVQRSPVRRHAPSDGDSEPEAQQPAGRGMTEDFYYDTDRRNANFEPETTPGYGRPVNNSTYHNNIYDNNNRSVSTYCEAVLDNRNELAYFKTQHLPLSHPFSRCPIRVLTACGGCGVGARCRRGGFGGGGGVVGGQRPTDADECSPGDDLSSSLTSPPVSKGDEEPCDRRPPAQLDLPAAPTAVPGGRRPVPRVWNSNILSAVLCLIKELDFPSLEVVEVAVRSRMEEF